MSDVQVEHPADPPLPVSVQTGQAALTRAEPERHEVHPPPAQVLQFEGQARQLLPESRY